MALRREARERDLGDTLRLDPYSLAAALFLGEPTEDRSGTTQRLQLLPQVARGFHRVTGAGASGGTQPTVLAVTQHQRPDRTFDARRVLVSDDDELLVLPAFRFGPAVVAPRTIGRIAPLRDQAFKFVLAGVLHHLRAGDFEVLAQSDHASAEIGRAQV